jgi:hypothetical protein
MEVLRFVLQWLVLRALRDVQLELSFKAIRRRIPVWIHLLDAIGKFGEGFFLHKDSTFALFLNI